MKRINAIVLTVALFFVAMTADAKVYENGKSYLNAGIGLGSTLVGDITLPPISASYEMGFTDKISAGGFVGFALSEEDYSFGTYSYSHIIIGGRGSYHFYNEKDMEAYAGAMVGYNIVSASYESKSGYTASGSASGSDLTYSVYLGGRYMFTEMLGVYGEFGYGVSYLNVGITAKF